MDVPTGFAVRNRRCRVWPATGLALAVAMLTGMATAAHAAKTTTSKATGNWTTPATWNNGLPAVGDTVILANGYNVTLSAAPGVVMDSVTIDSGGTLTFNGWNTKLEATTVTVNGTITHPVQSDVTGTPGVYVDWTPDNRIWIVCSNLTVAAGQKINVEGMGYQGGNNNSDGYGPGGGTAAANSGGAYGGAGYNNGNTYGSLTAPTDPGSGGGCGGSGYSQTANGGGAVRIEATGAVTVNGTIDADAIYPVRSSGESGLGSGGAIYVTCATLQGSGVLTAMGHYNAGSGLNGGPGGGGRIAIEITDPAAQADVTSRPSMLPLRGEKLMSQGPAWDGTLYAFHPSGLPELYAAGHTLTPTWPSAIEWQPSSLTISNCTIYLPTNRAVRVLNNLLLTNSANLWVQAGVTNATWPTYTALISVDGDMIVSPGCTVYPSSVAYAASGPTNGGPVRFDVANLTVHSGGAINANGLGYAGGTSAHPDGYGKGPGKGTNSGSSRGAGGGHGGIGGDGMGGGLTGGGTYGVSNAPVDIGSGGGRGNNEADGRAGGGAVWIRATRTMTVNGTISANGTANTQFGGAGSGGSVFIACTDLTGGAAGVTNITANGGNGASRGGGGGGRVAVWYDTTLDQLDSYLATGAGANHLTTNAPAGFSGALSAKGGVASDATPTYNGQDGTWSFYSIPPPAGTIIFIR